MEGKLINDMDKINIGNKPLEAMATITLTTPFCQITNDGITVECQGFTRHFQHPGNQDHRLYALNGRQNLTVFGLRQQAPLNDGKFLDAGPCDLVLEFPGPNPRNNIVNELRRRGYAATD